MGDITKMKSWIEAEQVITTVFRLIEVETEIVHYRRDVNKKILDLVDNFTYQTIIFRGRVDFTESTAVYLTKNSKIDDKTKKELKKIIPVEDREKWITNSDKKWLECFDSGYPYHHAKIRPKQKSYAVNAFEQNLAKAIIATPTLMMGVNLPADQIIIVDKMIGGKIISSIDLKQMIGRVGRPGKSKEEIGHAKILINNEGNRAFYQNALAEDGKIESHLNGTSALLPLLKLVNSGLIENSETVDELKHQTFEKMSKLNSENKNKRIFKRVELLLASNHPIDQAINELMKMDAIRTSEDGKFEFQEFGKVCIDNDLQPDVAFNLINSELGAKPIGTLEFFDILLKNIYCDFKPTEKQHLSIEIAKDVLYKSGEVYNPDEWTMREVGAVILWSLTKGKSKEECSDFFMVYPYSITDSVNSISKWIESIRKNMDLFKIESSNIEQLNYLPNQLKYGLTDNEVIFSLIPGVKHERAKVLAQQFSSLDEIINTDLDFLSKIKVNQKALGKSLAFKIRNTVESKLFNEHVLFRCPECDHSIIFLEVDQYGRVKCENCKKESFFKDYVKEKRYFVVDTCCLVNRIFSEMSQKSIPFELEYSISGWTLAELRDLEKKDGQKEKGKNGFRELTFLERNLPSDKLNILPEKTVQELHEGKKGDKHFADHELMNYSDNIKGYFFTQDENTARSCEINKIPVVFIKNIP